MRSRNRRNRIDNRRRRNINDAPSVINVRITQLLDTRITQTGDRRVVY